MDCAEARTHLLDRRRGALRAPAKDAVEAHLAECEACRQEDAADRLLSTLLETRLPQRRAPDALRREVESRWPSRPPRRRAAWMARTALAMAAGAAMALLVVLALRGRSAGDVMVAEAVNDHLRVLYSEHPLEVESGGIHQVKPWFEGRLDFAPVVPFAGDDDFPLQGGAVAYFLDRKAATLVFKRRLHVITLFVFRAEGLPWGAGTAASASRGFHVLLWRAGDLGYALVSDVDPRELDTLASKVKGQGL